MIINDDCLNAMKSMDDNSVDFIITDPPYGLGFNNLKWDKTLPQIDVWSECLRICKPGSLMAVFGGVRTHHRLMCNIEDSGWIIKDIMMWLYSNGFPKGIVDIGFSGYHTALKPAWEPIIIAEKKIEKTYKHNVEKYGVGGFNIEASRIIRDNKDYSKRDTFYSQSCIFKRRLDRTFIPTKDRWPSNVLLCEESKDILDKSVKSKLPVSRFFYCAKAVRKDGEFHPTAKPISLMTYIVTLLAPPTDPLCLDPFCGSGTTLLACQELGIRSVGIEIDKNYCEISEKRLKKEQKSGT